MRMEMNVTPGLDIVGSIRTDEFQFFIKYKPDVSIIKRIKKNKNFFCLDITAVCNHMSCHYFSLHKKRIKRIKNIIKV